MNVTPFELWFVECALFASDANLAPRDYLWNLQEPGHWLECFEAGEDPHDAAQRFFQNLH